MTENDFNPVFSLNGKTVYWWDSKFYRELMGIADNGGGMNELKILSFLWESFPALVTIQELAELLGYSCLEQSDVFNNIYEAMSDTREFIQRPTYSLKGLIEIETVSGKGYCLKPVEKE